MRLSGGAKRKQRNRMTLWSIACVGGFRQSRLLVLRCMMKHIIVSLISYCPMAAASFSFFSGSPFLPALKDDSWIQYCSSVDKSISHTGFQRENRSRVGAKESLGCKNDEDEKDYFKVGRLMTSIVCF